jgi:deoxyribonuclease-4
VEGLLRTKKLGLTAMEIEWVRNVPKSEERMAEIRETAEELKISLTVHGSYFINLNAPDRATLAASKKRVLDALAMAELCGASSVCIHAAFMMGEPPEKVMESVRRATEEIMEKKHELFPHVNLAYETMGKPTQFGTLEEVLKLSKEFGIYPCVDPAHMHARENGKWNSTEEWNTMFDLYEKYLGKKSLKHVHMHYSGIAYTARGERKHLSLQKSDAKWKDFLRVLKKRKIEGVVVCESPLLEDDTLLMKKMYERLR